MRAFLIYKSLLFIQDRITIMTDMPQTSVDADAVIKGFGEASETTLLLLEALKLFLATERSGVRNPYEEISDSEVIALCIHPERLPKELNRFILWQTNILKLDAGEIAQTEVPKGFKFKYDVKGARLAEMSSDEERKLCIQTYINEQENYFSKFNEVLAILEATEDRFMTIEGVLLRAESRGGGMAQHINSEKQALDDIRKKLCDIRAILENDVLPDLISFENTPDIAKGLMTQLSALNISLRDNIRKHNVG